MCCGGGCEVLEEKVGVVVVGCGCGDGDEGVNF